MEFESSITKFALAHQNKLIQVFTSYRIIYCITQPYQQLYQQPYHQLYHLPYHLPYHQPYHQPYHHRIINCITQPYNLRSIAPLY